MLEKPLKSRSLPVKARSREESWIWESLKAEIYVRKVAPLGRSCRQVPNYTERECIESAGDRGVTGVRSCIIRQKRPAKTTSSTVSSNAASDDIREEYYATVRVQTRAWRGAQRCLKCGISSRCGASRTGWRRTLLLYVDRPQRLVTEPGGIYFESALRYMPWLVQK